MTQSSHHSLLSRLSLFVLSGCIALQGQAWAMGQIDIASQKNLGMESVRLESGGDLTLYAKDDLILSPGVEVREQGSAAALPSAAASSRTMRFGLVAEPGVSRRVTERTVIQNHLHPGMKPGITFDNLALDQLNNNKLPLTGTPNMPTGSKK